MEIEQLGTNIQTARTINLTIRDLRKTINSINLRMLGLLKKV